MNYKIESIPYFDKNAKVLSKKYPSLRNDLEELEISLSQNPFLGDSLGRGCYKVRMAISSKGKGKSGGARIITYVYITRQTVYLLSIYDKSDKESISEKELKQLLSFIK